MSKHVLIRLIRFVSRFTIHLCNVIYFLTTFNIPCKRFTKILYFVFWDLNRAYVLEHTSIPTRALSTCNYAFDEKYSAPKSMINQANGLFFRKVYSGPTESPRVAAASSSTRGSSCLTSSYVEAWKSRPTKGGNNDHS